MMRVLTASASDAPSLAESLRQSLLVIGLCATWCGTCREFKPTFDRLAEANPDATFIWLDVEDDSEIAGDIDVQNFPTLAIFRNRIPIHFGVTQPHEGVVARLLSALAQRATPLVDVADEVSALPALLDDHARALA